MSGCKEKTRYTGDQLLDKIDDLIGNRWEPGPRNHVSKIIDYEEYQIMQLETCIYIAKDTVNKIKEGEAKGCTWWANYVRNGFQEWSNKWEIPDICMGSISALHVGFHHPDPSTPNLGHRLNWVLTAEGDLWFLDMAYHENPDRDRWVYPLTDADNNFYALLA